ncbi:carboxylesterase/lipase family protein [Corynebacterium sp. CCM 8835]|uniref:Carboxylic ester hydrolase n=1 Tax=Corynebacterium antarcticum TaxID=2800405 RepID=A0A9Q4GL07_9CORY|nr:carboxylesterase/lipase family protein [Corynebacterium antarcticum]MCK7642951.1 carboxylesterase/lipase family protein [Corynebacterium antarcticum]MCK7661454.1 carboxylesterase/lipase family protein [Corynebacterium antarcticum]MCL0246191.1 carboxylesterase/lipase family protein [Corynebacterium antarcticum]MCX7492441.1 carboxylesterase/lipase family protein [Corynebacterium antarcticum]MCX7538447.1 carboxylesterase/lipase family protein [Corynebacterium antarcticum]
MDDITVTTAGLIRGTLVSGIRTWRGVPYGADTSGPNRWRAPSAPEPWRGVRDCSEFGTVAPQPVYSYKDSVRGGEDCLNLDIVRPDSDDDDLPVVVYLHGGSFIVGSSHETMLRGYNFVRNLNVVYVSVNFRLGVLGYLDLRSLGDDDCVANPAVRDQLLALHWIRGNIRAFGGDPDNVTLMGESAGGAAVTTLMCVPSAEGLFHKAIAQSAPAATLHAPVQSEYWAQQLVDAMALPLGTTCADLRLESAADLVRAGQSMLWRSREMLQLNSCYGPTVDGELLPEHPLDAFAAGRQIKVPLLIGTNNDEASVTKLLYLRQTARSRAAARMLDAYDHSNSAVLLDAYNGAIERADFARMLTDAVFWAPSLRIAEDHSRYADTWMYRFDYAPAALRWIGLGAMHSFELTAVFAAHRESRTHTLTRFGGIDDLGVVTSEMQAYWGNFIHHSIPGSGWPRYRLAGDTRPGRATRIFDSESTVAYDPRPHLRRAWRNYDMREWGAGRPDILEIRGTAPDEAHSSAEAGQSGG